MNTDFDPLEAELRSLRPREFSSGLKRRIAAELASATAAKSGWLWSAQPPTARVPGHSTSRFFFVAACLAAALLIAALFIPQDNRRAVESPLPLADSPTAAAFDAALPSVWQFHNALNRSATDLDAVLDQHAARAPAPVISFVQIRGLGRSDDQLETLLGEL